MKPLYITMALIMFFSMLLFPLAAVGASPGDIAEQGEESAAAVAEDSFLVYFKDEERAESMSAEDYIYSVVAAEMPAGYNEEALKAQAVAAYTYACYKREARRAAGESFDVIADSATEQAFLPAAALAERWGDKSGEYEKKIRAAVREVSGYIITYESRPIMAVFHAISSGKTESAENVWGNRLPYLVPTESVGDLLAPDYLSELSLSPDEFSNIAAGLSVTLPDNIDEWVSPPQCSDSGTVMSIRLGDKNFTGQQMREAFALRSASFDLNFTEGRFVFTVRGYGHDVGMSQYGANHMAEQGSGYAEILSWYYPGCVLEKAAV